MKFDSLINSHHDLKKNGYKILRKLHILEKRSNLSKVYAARCANGYFVVLSCKNLADILLDLYGHCEDVFIKRFLKKTNAFTNYLDTIAMKQTKIDANILSSYLTSYTHFFNYIINDCSLKFIPDKSFLSKWNMGCIMAYTAVWGNK